MNCFFCMYMEQLFTFHLLNFRQGRLKQAHENCSQQNQEIYVPSVWETVKQDG